VRKAPCQCAFSASGLGLGQRVRAVVRFVCAVRVEPGMLLFLVLREAANDEGDYKECEQEVDHVAGFLRLGRF
jgi:hypothetical protein